MKHFDEITIQKYIDNELSPEERVAVEMHLETCEECKKQVENQRVFSEKVKDSLDGFVPDDIKIPEFKLSYQPKKTRTLRIVLISSLSTACAILLAFFIIKGLKKEPENFDIYDFITIEEYDANKPMTEQLFTYMENNI
jgi:anti-sigma factor RsiW